MHGLPMASMNKQNISSIGASIGRPVDIDPILDGISCKWFFLIKVSFNVDLPLKEGFLLSRPHLTNAYIHFRCKKLSDFCYYCGCLGHTMYLCIQG